MRWWTGLAVVVLVAGCSSPASPAARPSSTTGPATPDHVDDLTARLDPASGGFLRTLWLKDHWDFPAGGNISFAIGLGMRCEGNASALAPEARGWVTCSVRLASDHAAMSSDRRPLELGFDYQWLSPRIAAEAVEWRVVVERAADAAGNASVLSDSGWRAVDLSPSLSTPHLDLEVVDACDEPDAIESPPPQDHGLAILNVTFSVLTLAQVTLDVDLAASSPGLPGSSPYSIPNATAHGFRTAFPAWGEPRAMWLRLPVHLDSNTTPDGSQGPCLATIAHEVQSWTVHVAFVGADGRGGSVDLTQPVDVYVTMAAQP